MQAMNHYWKDKERIEQFRNDYNAVNLTAIEVAYCEYAIQMTMFPGKNTSEIIQRLSSLDQDDRAILDATMIIGYFNFVNRIVAGLQVKLEAEGAGGYDFS
jgi:alkylhydroperoxidase family enzyme